MENDLIVNVLSMGWVSLYIISALSAHIPYLADLVNKDGDLFSSAAVLSLCVHQG